MRFIAVALVAIAALVAPVAADGQSQMSMEAALALAARGGSASSVTHTYTMQSSTETVRTIETHIRIDVTVVQTERETIEHKESWIASWKASGKATSDATFKMYVKERDEAKVRWFAARRRILEGRIAISIHIHRWGSSIRSEFVEDMTSLYQDIVTFNHDVEAFISFIGHGIVKIGEITIGALVFAGVEAWHFGGKVVHTSEDAFNAILGDAKNIWISFGLHLDLFWNTIKTDISNTYNRAKNGLQDFETNTSNKIHGAIDGWQHPTIGAPTPTCPPCPDCSHTTATHADSMESDMAAKHENSHRRQHKGVHVEVAVN